MAKGKKVNITLKSVSKAAGCLPDVMELMTEGTMKPALHDGCSGWEISYEDSEATGFIGSTTTVSCFGEKMASMNRTGMYADTSLIIEKDRKHHCHYGTEYGDMLIGIYTHRIINRLNENGGELYFKYTLDVNSALLSDTEVYINITPAE